MSNNTTNNELGAIRQLLDSNLRLAIDRLLAYLQNRNREYYFQTLLIKSDFLKLGHSAPKTDFIQSISSILDALQDTQEDKTIEYSPEFLSEALKRIIDNGLQRKVMLECKNLSKSFKKSKFSLQIENFNLRQGDLVGLVGENGNGKSTFLKILAGEMGADKGDLFYFGSKKAINETEWFDTKSKIGYLPQEIKGISGRVIDSIRMYASLHGIKGKDNDYEVDYIIARLGLENWKNAKWNDLSGGYKLKIALAKILVCKPKIILLDEPLAFLDINAKNVLLTDLKSLTHSIDNPISIILSSQNLEEVEAVADKMLVIEKGQITFNDLTSNIGKSRTENTFEIQTNLAFKALEDKLSELKYLEMEYNGYSYIIRTPLNININDVMRYCINAEIPIKMIYDISTSTKNILMHSKPAA